MLRPQSTLKRRIVDIAYFIMDGTYVPQSFPFTWTSVEYGSLGPCESAPNGPAYRSVKTCEQYAQTQITLRRDMRRNSPHLAIAWIVLGMLARETPSHSPRERRAWIKLVSPGQETQQQDQER